MKEKSRTYRGIRIHLKPGKIAKDPDSRRVAGEIYFPNQSRRWVAQCATVDGMMFRARRMIDEELDRQEDIETRWFRTAIV